MLEHFEKGNKTSLFIYDPVQDKLLGCTGVINIVKDQLIIRLDQCAGSSPGQGERLLFSFAEDTGLQFYTCVVDKVTKQGNMAQITCRQMQLVESMQRRKHARVEVHLPVEVTVDTNPLAEVFDPTKQQYCEGEIINISGGGLHFRSRSKLPLDTLLALYFEVTGVGNVDAMAEVVRVVEKSDGFYMGIKFVGLRPEVESKIITYVNQAQLRQKKDGTRPVKAALMRLKSMEDIPAVLGLVKYKGMDLSHLQDKTSRAIIKEIDYYSIKMDSGLKIPLGMEVSLKVDLAEVGPLNIGGMVTAVHEKEDNQIAVEIQIEHTPEVEKKLVWYIFRKYFRNEE